MLLLVTEIRTNLPVGWKVIKKDTQRTDRQKRKTLLGRKLHKITELYTERPSVFPNMNLKSSHKRHI
jgi:hypothetical protein